MEENNKKVKKTKSSKNLEKEEAVPAHIRNIMKGVDKRSKSRKKEHEEKKQQSMDSIALIRQMMSSVRIKCELSDSTDVEVRKDKEQDHRMISNARDIFKHLESQDDNQLERKQIEKVKRVEVKPDFLLDGQNKAEELRKERLKEMTAMKMARERQLEEDERYQNSEKNRGDELRKQREREMDIMRMARQQALEEEERIQAESAKRFVREVSPGLAAARQGFKIDRQEEDDKMERIRIERERELESMRKARAMQLEEEMFEQSRTQKSEASRELEAFRASRGQQPLGERYLGNQNQENQDKQLRRAPRSKRIADNWMKQDEEDKIEEMRRARERELEMMMNARNIAFEEEEEERLYQEALRREEAEKKGREMAMLVAELQRMRNETQENGIQDEKMTKYQEEMLQRVMELHAIARGGLLSN